MKRLNILVVEDDDLVAELIGEMLADMKHIVCTTTATQSGAVTAAKLYNPDLMIVDVMLREGNGLDAVDLILQRGHVPHFFVSGDVAKVLKLRPDAIVVLKPYTEATLVAAMNHALAQAPKRAT
jgi:CheY-like chemotaxis protein